MIATGLTRKPAFWIGYALAAAAALALAWRLFPLAIPLVNLDIRLARDDAIAKAEAVAQALKLAPEGARAAARFAHDQAAQNYIELEGGGKPAFAAVVAGNVYAPYWWDVRLFQPGEATEATIRFRPDGGRNGFVQKLPEKFVPADPAGLALSESAARQLAENGARADWGVDFAPFRLLEHTQQERTTGRVDHTFVYERTAGNIAEARFRLRLAVTGNALTEVTHFVHVPESFDRRFQELRSANNTIAGGAALTAGVLYGIGGCLLGTLWLLRHAWLQWRPAVVAGFIVGGLMGAMLLADAPAAWFDFDTAQSTTTFWLRQAGGAALATLAGGLGYGLVFMAAEGLSRRAFADHPQLWRLWSRAAAPTKAVLGRTLGGYLFVPIGLGLIMAFYYATNRWLGWWQPSESLTDPEHPRQRRAGAFADRDLAAGGLHGGMPVPRDPAVARGAHRRALRSAQPRDRDGGRRPGARLRRRPRELPGLPVLLAPGRALGPGDGVGAHLPAFRAAADDPAARAVRPHADLDSAVSRRCARKRSAARARRRGGHGAARGRRCAATARRQLARAPRRTAQRGMAAARSRAGRGARRASDRQGFGGRLGGSLPARAPDARADRARRVGTRHAVSFRCAAAARHARGGRGRRGRRAQGARRESRIRLAALRHRQGSDRRRRDVARAPVRVARDRTRWLRESHRPHARAAAVGRPLRAIRRRARRSCRRMACDDRRHRRGAAGAARASRGSPGRQALACRSVRARANASCAKSGDSTRRR